MSRNQVQPCTGFGAADVVGAFVVGAAVVVGALVVGATVVGGFVVGAAALLTTGAAALVVGAITTGMVDVATEVALAEADRAGDVAFRVAVTTAPGADVACAATVPTATALPPASGLAADADADRAALDEADADVFGGFTVETSSTGAGGAATATAGDTEVHEPAGVYAVFRALPQPVTTAQATPKASRPAPTRSGRGAVARVIERIVIRPAPPGIVAAELPRRCAEGVAASG